MSTRSNVAVVDPVTKKIKVIYVHSDGYIDGVGLCLHKYYNNHLLADNLVNHGSASYLGDSIDECYFYGRDRGEEKQTPQRFRDEWNYFYSMRGDYMIEYIYIFKENNWYVSECKSVEKPKDSYADEGVYYWTKPKLLIEHEEFPKGDSKPKTSEVKMMSQLGKMLSDKFGEDNILMQREKIKKPN